jgi:hypothetical protein
VHWLLNAIAHPLPFEQRTSATYMVDVQFIETLSGLIGAAELPAQQMLAAHIADLAPVQQQLEAHAWALTIDALPAHAWTEEVIARAVDTADRHDDELRRAILRRAFRSGSAAARARVVDEIRGGSLDAVGAVGDLRALPSDAAASAITMMSTVVDSMIEQARAGVQGLGPTNPATDLGLINAWHPRQASWDPLVRLLLEDLVFVDSKSCVLRVLADLADRIEEPHRQRLGEAALYLAQRRGEVHFGAFTARDAAGEAAVLAHALGVVDEQTYAELLVALLAEPGDRPWAARLAADQQDLSSLVALSADNDPAVRSMAAWGLMRAADAGTATAAATAALEPLLSDGGVRVAAAVAAAARLGTSEPADRARRRLEEHPSAAVRRTIHLT